MADLDPTRKFLVGDLPGGQRAFACIALSRFTEPRLDDSRLGAALRPYPDEIAAGAALEAAGAVDVREDRR